ncbi:hypothetical protein ZWY2020_050477 [Hordeum vulgare]|nr:hypothetical protein ZWY2020_050477 [Hordeum vulgare]
MSKFATPPPARNLDMSHVLDDATYPAHDAMLDTALPDDAMLDTALPDDAMLDTALPLGAFLDAQIARVAARCDDTSETADTTEVEPTILRARNSSPRNELPDMPECYVMEGEIAEDFLACKDSYDVEKLLLKWKEKSLNARMKYDPKVITRGGRMTQEPLYPEGHPRRIEQDSQGVSTNAPSHPKKKRDDRNLHASNPDAVTPESDEHEPNDNTNSDVHDDGQPSNDKDVEIELVDLDNPQPKNRRYDKNDFAARKHSKEREPWVQKPMPFPPIPSKKKDDEDFEHFVEIITPVFLQMRLTDMLKMYPYAKYMKDIVTNKRRIPEVEISTMLANYTFKGGTPKKLGDPGVPTIPCSIKGNYVRNALCDLGAGVNVMPLSLYRRLELDKLTPTEISLQMANKSTAFPIGICEDVPVVVANVTILTNFVILDILEADAMAVILGRPFLNTPGAVIDCNKGNVTFHVNGRYIIMPSNIYTYWGLAQPNVPVPEPPVEYQTPVYQWEPKELTQQWHPQSTPEYPGAGYFPPWE